MKYDTPVVVIIGGGFGGLSSARALKRFRGKVILIDRSNHHLFQPLLYQVATSVLSPSQIASPIRNILAKQDNTMVILGEVVGVDADRKQVIVDAADRKGVPVKFDYLIVATGVQLNYFGHEDFSKNAPGLKTIRDAVLIRNRILQAFEDAETEEDTSLHQNTLTFVLVGGGPTGVEMAGAIAVMIKSTLRREFRRIDPLKARVILVDGGSRPLGTFDPSLSQAALRRLEKLGVETLFGHHVEQVTDEGVSVNGQWIPSKTVIWTAGVTPSPAGKWLGVPTDRAGRVCIAPDLTVPGKPNVFVVGDTASLNQDGVPLPGVAQVAIQQGRYASSVIMARAQQRKPPKPFRYFDKGNLAVVGKGFAVLQSGPVKMSGIFAWMVWALVHIQFLAQRGLRISVLMQWLWTFLTNQRGSRLIIRQQ